MTPLFKDSERREVDIFATASEMTSDDDRSTFLDTVCAGQPDLRRRVEDLLRASGDADEFFRSAAPHIATTAAEHPGDLIGRYRLLEKIGEGGCGTVYLAEQVEPLRRRVALKIIKLGMDTRSVIARFEAERQALAVMDHPNIARVFDAGATSTGRPFFVMEFVRGERITDYCDSRSLDVAARLRLFVKVCDAIGHAHQKGIIHRDIKPSNILVTEDEREPCPKVIDFGIAKATNGVSLTDRTLLTRPESFVGTPDYMSPEQAGAYSSDIDTRTDIYSLGGLLYTLLTGRTPFDSGKLLRDGPDVLYKTVRERAPQRPSTRFGTLTPDERAKIAAGRDVSPYVLETRLRGDLDWIVLKAMEKDRHRRYSSADALADDVRRHLADEPVTARPPDRLYESLKWARRNRPVVVGVIAFAVVLLVGIVVSVAQALRAHRAEQLESRLRIQAELSGTRAREQAYASDMKAASIALNEHNLGQAVDLLRRHLPTDGTPDFRGLEWRYLWQAVKGDDLAAIPHERIISAVTVSPDGKFIATGCFNGDIKIFTADRQTLVKQFPGDPAAFALETIVFSPDSKFFAHGRTGGVTIRSVSNWEAVGELDEPVHTLAFSKDGLSLACIGHRDFRFYDVAGWTLRTRVPTRWGGLHAVRMRFSNDGRFLAASTRSHRAVQIRDARTGELVREVGLDMWPISLAISPDSQTVVAGDEKGTVALWRLEDGAQLASFEAHTVWAIGIEYSPAGDRFATGGGDQVIRLWDVSGANASKPALVGQMQGHLNEIWDIAFLPDGRRIASVGKDATLRIWSAEPPAEKSVMMPTVSENNAFVGSEPGGHFGWFAGVSNNFLQVDLRTATVMKTVSLESEPLRKVGRGDAILFEKGKLFFGTTDGRFVSKLLGSEEPLQTVGVHPPELSIYRASPDWRTAFGVNRTNGTYGLWDLGSGRFIDAIPDFDISQATFGWERGKRSAFSPDGRLFAYAGPDFTIIIRDVHARRNVGVLRGHTWNIYCIRFSEDGRRLASGSWDGQVRVWDPETATGISDSLKGHLGGVNNVEFTSDGQSLITSGDDLTVRMWHLSTGTETVTFRKAITIEGRILSEDGNYLVWTDQAPKRIRITRIQELAEAALGGNPAAKAR
jgi:serine/threonine protein kinase/WD40 repeat protein